MHIKLNLIVSRALIVKVTAATLVFILSFLIMPYYTDGDQKVYRAVYEALPNLDITNGFLFYTFKLSSQEFVHFYLSWLASHFIDKDLFTAISNATLAYVAMSLFQKWKVSDIISFSLLLTNFYFLVLYFPAERLKFGFIFLILSLIYIDQVKRFYGLVILALISHVQVIIVYSAIFCNVLFVQFLKLIHTGKISKSTLFIIPFVFIPPLLIGDHLIVKFMAYYGEGGLAGLARILIFLLLAVFYSKEKSKTIAIFIPIVIAVFLVGGERINLFGYFVFLYYGLQFRRGWNFGVLATSTYYAYSSVGFLINIFKNGDGFISG